MKNNNLFRKFLALFLTGTMLAGVGCKDYDDDIDDINKKIDDLNAKVELKADASALQTISDKLKDVDFSKFVTDAELSQELAAYVKDADLKKKVGDLGFQTVTQVQDLIKGLQNEAQVKALIENQLKAADLWSKIGGEVKKGILEELAKNSELTTAVKNQAVAAVLAAITNDPAVKDIKTAISKIAGEEASEFVKEYMDVNNKAWIENVNSAAAEAVKNRRIRIEQADHQPHFDAGLPEEERPDCGTRRLQAGHRPTSGRCRCADQPHPVAGKRSRNHVCWQWRILYYDGFLQGRSHPHRQRNGHADLPRHAGLAGQRPRRCLC